MDGWIIWVSIPIVDFFFQRVNYQSETRIPGEQFPFHGVPSLIPLQERQRLPIACSQQRDRSHQVVLHPHTETTHTWPGTKK